MTQSQGAIPQHEDSPLFYRVSHASIHTFFDNDIRFCCDRWLRERDFEEPSRQDFIDRIEDEAFESPYISMTDSPYRVLKLRLWLSEKVSPEVFVIDAAGLRTIRIRV